MEEKEDIVITVYNNGYYSDLVEGGYYALTPFHTYLKPDFRSGIKKFLSINEMKMFVNRTFLLNSEELTLVAYFRKDKKAVGSITSRKITKSLWSIWSLFVSPTYRGRKIGPMLISETFRRLKRKDAEKAIAIIAKSNVSSIKATERATDQGFLDNRIFRCKRFNPLIENDSEEITVRKSRPDEKEQLFNVFENCVGKNWNSYLEIDHENFLNRIYGPAFWEQYGPLSKLVMKKKILVAESKGEVRGYVISRATRFSSSNYALHLFVPISRDFSDICKALLLKTSRPPNYKAQDKFSFVYIGDEESRKYLEKLGLEVTEFMVRYHLL